MSARGVTLYSEKYLVKLFQDHVHKVIFLNTVALAVAVSHSQRALAQTIVFLPKP